MASKAEYLKKYIRKGLKGPPRNKVVSSSGLTLGSDSEPELGPNVKRRAAASSQQQKALSRVLPLSKDGNKYLFTEALEGEEFPESDEEVRVVDADGQILQLSEEDKRKVAQLIADQENNDASYPEKPPIFPLQANQQTDAELSNEDWKAAFTIKYNTAPDGRSGKDTDLSPPRRSRAAANLSPPRISRDGRSGKDTDLSPPRRSRAAANLSPPRISRDGRSGKDTNILASHWGTESGIAPLSQRRGRPPGEQSSSYGYHGHQTTSERAGGGRVEQTNTTIEQAQPRIIFRDKEGRAISEEEWLTLEGAKGRKGNRRERGPAPILEWGSGLRQREDSDKRRREDAEIARQPFARYEIDANYDADLKARERWDDPLSRAPKAHSEEHKGVDTLTGDALPRRPTCPHDAPPNRFGIKPGYRWDGVLRGNGFEDKRIETINRRKWETEIAHMNNVADM